jgi:crotonobetainyl-CoA:carnitine CoA-transferase CaiB-like acyl-CoA transferase
MPVTARNAQSEATDRDRPAARFYPIFRCVDGYVRIAVLSARQWKGLFGWLGEPQQFADPKYELTAHRFESADELNPLIGALFASERLHDLVDEGQRRGVPLAPVFDIDDILQADHYRDRGSFTTTQIDGEAAALPAGYWIADGTRLGPRGVAPAVGQHESEIDWDHRRPGTVTSTALPQAAALHGLRVLDLGRIVMGAEAGRLLADQGADVIKIESRAFPDGSRVLGMRPAAAAAQRNKRGLGLDLRSVEGVRLFERLVQQSDVVLTNFKPGTLESLQLGFEELSRINPSIVLSKSSAMGDSGPWATWMGYGPLVRSVSGLTTMWRDRGLADGFADATTIFPDHFVGRVADVGVLAALVGRDTTDRGACIETSQAEAILMSLSTVFVSASLGEQAEPGYGAPWAVLPCSGDDEWCVVTVATDDQWASLVEAIGRPAWAVDPGLASAGVRMERRDELHKWLAEWTGSRTPLEATEALQAVGVPAAPMLRAAEVVTDPHLVARRFFRELTQPGLKRPVTMENGPAHFARRGDPVLRPAPNHGEHTREICTELLELTDSEIATLLAEGVLEEALERPAEP